MKKGYKYIFSEEARALALCVENEAVLYPRIKSIVKMLARKYAKGTYDHAKGTYDHAKAPLAYLCVVVEMAKLYHKRYGTPGTKYYDMFNPQIRYSANGAIFNSWAISCCANQCCAGSGYGPLSGGGTLSSIAQGKPILALRGGKV